MQLATLLVGLMAATALWSGVQAINAQARTSYDRAAASFGGANAAMLVPAQASSVPQSLFADLRRAGWLVSPVVEGRVRVGGRSVRIIGVEPLSLPRGAGPAPSIGDAALQNFLGARRPDADRLPKRRGSFRRARATCSRSRTAARCRRCISSPTLRRVCW